MVQQLAEDDWPENITEIADDPRSYLNCLTESDLQRFDDYLAYKSTLSQDKMLVWSEHVSWCSSCAKQMQELPNVANWRLEQTVSEHQQEMVAMRYILA